MKQVVAEKKDFRVERMRGSGPGGQKRNKTDSCVRITHVPTGLSEYCCETKSQHQNMKLAFTRLATRVVSEIVPRQVADRYAGGHKVIRSYNEQDDRVVDHETGDRFSFKQTIGKGDMGPIIESRSHGKLGI